MGAFLVGIDGTMRTHWVVVEMTSDIADKAKALGLKLEPIAGTYVAHDFGAEVMFDYDITDEDGVLHFISAKLSKAEYKLLKRDNVRMSRLYDFRRHRSEPFKKVKRLC